ncbi:MAG: hypothetical protein AAFY73_10240 [Pseudomonadota bacterium]
MRTTTRTTANDLAMSLSRLIRSSVDHATQSFADEAMRQQRAGLQRTGELDTDFDAGDGRIRRRLSRGLASRRQA